MCIETKHSILYLQVSRLVVPNGNPFLITFRTLFSVKVSGVNIYETIVFNYCFATPFFFLQEYKLENLSLHSLSINSQSSYHWPWALLESSFLYWLEMFSYISTCSSVPCGYTEQILFHTTAFQLFEDGYVHTPTPSLPQAIFHQSLLWFLYHPVFSI